MNLDMERENTSILMGNLTLETGTMVKNKVKALLHIPMGLNTQGIFIIQRGTVRVSKATLIVSTLAHGLTIRGMVRAHLLLKVEKLTLEIFTMEKDKARALTLIPMVTHTQVTGTKARDTDKESQLLKMARLGSAIGSKERKTPATGLERPIRSCNIYDGGALYDYL